MPVYEYACKKCNKVIEIVQKFSDSPLKKHIEAEPKAACKGTLSKLISKNSFMLKGRGWAKDGY